MSVYVFRIDEGNEKIIDEIKNGNLRQGWGAAGMSVQESYEDFLDAWIKKWGTPNPNENVKNRYRNLSIMKDMSPSDLIVIPKLSLDKSMTNHSFTIVKVIGKYSFEPIDGINDFGHIIPVEFVLSCPYDANDFSRTINKKMRAYQSAVNNCWNSAFCEAVESIINGYSSNPDKYKEEISELEALSYSDYCKSGRKEYLESIINQINEWSGQKFEKLIIELFEKNNYRVVRTNHYDGKGADVDIEILAICEGTLAYDLFTVNDFVSDSMPRLCIQAKNKRDKDYDDVKGVNQLVYSKENNAENNISYILINLTKEFSDDAKGLAKKNGIMLINGFEFASLMVKYGLDASLV